MLVGGGANLVGALVVVSGTNAYSSKLMQSWLFVQCLSGIWAGVLGANSPFLNGIVAGIPSIAVALMVGERMPWPMAVIAWFLVPASALVAAAVMRFMRKRGP